MSSSLSGIITALKNSALAAGFVDVEQYRINMTSNPDTLLPRMLIKLNGKSFGMQRINIVTRIYHFELTSIANVDTDPLGTLDALEEAFLANCYSDALLKKLLLQDKFILKSSSLTNDEAYYKIPGAESSTLRFNIENTNTFGGVAC